MIELKNLSVQFIGSVKALDQVNLIVPDRKNTVVIGESGSGKSVMLSAILQILPPSAAVTGSILLEGKELLTLSEKDMRALRGSSIAYIPQGGSTSMNPLLTVGYQIAEPLMEKQRIPKEKAISSAISWMRRLHVGHEEQLSASYPHTLSGGMRQRALIAMGAISGSPLLLADEPTKGLDGERVETVSELFRELQDRTLLCVSHDMNFVKSIADYVVIMYAAQIVEYCSCEEFFSNPLHPYSQMTLEAMPENGLRAHLGFAPTHEDMIELGCRFYSRCPHRTKDCKSAPPMVEKGNRKVRCWMYAD